jgi:hypothetical protein
MKTRIFALGIVAVFAYVLSSFNDVNGEKSYYAIENRNLKWHSIDAEQPSVRCTQCHNCQNNDLLVVENDSISGRKYFSNLNFVNSENAKTATMIVNQVDPKNDDESLDNSKSL